MTRQTNLFAARGTGMLAKCQAFAQTAMDEYDLDGWTVPDLINPDDVSILTRR
ncbi:4-nitrophenol 2-monooxygenase, oxygenase component [compost metagenome]